MSPTGRLKTYLLPTDLIRLYFKKKLFSYPIWSFANNYHEKKGMLS